MKSQVEKIINEEIRPHLKMDGGDIELVSVDEEKGIVKVKLQGACRGCPMAQMTLGQGVGRTLKEKVEGIKDVVAV